MLEFSVKATSEAFSIRSMAYIILEGKSWILGYLDFIFKIDRRRLQISKKVIRLVMRSW